MKHNRKVAKQPLISQFGKSIFIATIFILTFANVGLTAKIRLFTFHYNHPDFLEIQYRLLQKFLIEKDDFELIVFNDAKDPLMKMKIEETCSQLDIQCINFPQELHENIDDYPDFVIENMRHSKINSSNGSLRHCQIVQFALTNFGYKYDDIVGIMEGDVFLVKNFSIRRAIHDYDIIGGMQTDRIKKGIDYIWIGLSFFNIKQLPNKESLNFNLTWVENAFLDSGGNTYYYLKNNPSVRSKKFRGIRIKELSEIPETALTNQGFTPPEISFIQDMQYYYQTNKEIFPFSEYYLNNSFIHFGRSRYTDDRDLKSKLFFTLFQNLLA